MYDNILNLAIIGCGVIAPSHIESYLANDGTKISALCDLKSEKCKKLNERYSLDSQIFTDFRELFASQKIDAVSVCTDHLSHAEICVEALSSGVHVICEKPLAANPKGLNEILSAVDKHPQLVFSAVFQNRFNPVSLAIKELVNLNAFGKIVSCGISCSCLRTNEYYKSDFWRGKWATEGGSVMINQAIHYLDLLVWFCGKPISVCGKFANLAHEGVIETEDSVSAAIQFESGALGSVSVTCASFHNWQNALWISGTDGFILINNFKIVDAKFRNSEHLNIFETISNQKKYDSKISGKSYYGGQHYAQISDFVNAIKNGTKPFIDAQSAAIALRTVFAIYQSQREDRVVST